MKNLINEVFSLRHSELVTLVDTQPKSGRYVAVMARSVEMPPGNQRPISESGDAVENAAIVAAEWLPDPGEWIWSRLSQPTKEFIGDLIFDGPHELDKWYYVVIEDLTR